MPRPPEPCTDPASPRLLVVLRLGSDHRVSDWAKQPARNRGWDLLLSPYDRVGDLAEFDPTLTFACEGGKWDAIHRIFTAQPGLLDRYDYIWLPDDDLEMPPDAPGRLLAIAAAEGFDLCQPALCPDSGFSHLVTVRNRFTRFRYTNFVELMAPMMRPGVLARALPLMEGRWAAKGLDFIWQGFVPQGAERRIAIVDAVEVGHYRENGIHLESRIARAGTCEKRAGRSLLGREARRDFCPLSLAPAGGGGRAGATALTLLNLAANPVLWRAANLGRIASHLGGQFFLSDWQGTRSEVEAPARNKIARLPADGAGKPVPDVPVPDRGVQPVSRQAS